MFEKTLGRSSMNFEALRTILVEIEATINNRPLTYIYDDQEGIYYPLTPSQLIYGRQLTLTASFFFQMYKGLYVGLVVL